MRKITPSAAIVAALSLVSSAAFAEEFAILGPRAMGMGGAGVATTRGALSVYWNPAALAPPRAPSYDSSWDLSLPVSFTGSATNDFLGEVNDILDAADAVDFNQLEADLAAGAELTDTQFRQVLRLVDEIPDVARSGTGLTSVLAPGINLRIGRFALSAIGLVYAGGAANVDTDFLALGNSGIDAVVGSGTGTPTTANGSQLASDLTTLLDGRGVADASRIANEIAFQAEQAGISVSDPAFRDLLQNVVNTTQDAASTPVGTDRFFSSNQSGFDLRAILLQEYAIGYAQPFLDMVSVGVAPKLLYGTTYFNPFTLDALENFGDPLDELTDRSRREEGLSFGLDVGVLVMPLDWLSFGVVGKNLNEPSFEMIGPGKFTVEPQVRAGVGIGPFAGLTLAADIDVIENDSQVLPGYNSQVIGGGIEYSLFDVLMLRGGASKNLAEANEDLVVHLGLGLRIFTVAVDVAAMMGIDSTDLNLDNSGSPTTLPERVGASLMLSVNVPLQ